VDQVRNANGTNTSTGHQKSRLATCRGKNMEGKQQGDWSPIMEAGIKDVFKGVRVSGGMAYAKSGEHFAAVKCRKLVKKVLSR